MSHLLPAADELLDRASKRWRRLLFLQRTANLATLMIGLVLLLGIGLVAGWWTSAGWVTTGLVLAVIGPFLVWMVMTLLTICAVDVERRPWLAAAIEQHHRPLMDRLNTLVFLQHQRDPRMRAFAEKIEHQTQEVLVQQPPILPFSPRQALFQAGCFVAVLAVTILFSGWFRPWQCVVVAARDADSGAQHNELLEIPPWDEAPGETLRETTWGNVRISEPGTDLRVTSLDVVPLRIEAAANRPLTAVEWFLAVNGAEEVRHALPEPEDPSFAVYQPELSIRDAAAEAWDVVRYYARATTADGTNYDSQVYFVEVVPFRDELEQLSREEQGPGYERLEQLTSMIQRQNEVVRQTQRQARAANQPSADRQTELEQLAREEADLRKDASHLAAGLSSRTDRLATAGPEQRLQRAASTLKNAQDALRENDLDEALQNERTALDELVAARKDLHAFLRQNPGAAEHREDQSASSPSDAGSANESPTDKIQDMRDRQAQLQAAREFVQKTLLAQRNLEKQANPSQRDGFPDLAQQQRQLNRSLEDFVEENRPRFAGSQKQCSHARSTMNRTAQSLASRQTSSRREAGRAAEALQELDDSLEQQQQLWDRLADAHRIRKMLEQQVSGLSQCQQSGPRPGQGERLAQQAQQATSQLKQIAEGELSSEYFRDELRESLSDEQMEQMSGQCQRLGKAGNPAGQKTAAGELAQSLERVAQALDASCRGNSAQAGQGGRLIAEGQTAIARGLRCLESATRPSAGGQPLAAENRNRLAREARSNLAAGISSLYGDNESSEPMVRQLERKLEEPVHLIDLQTIRDLMSQVQQLSRGSVADKPDDPPAATRNVDLSRLPPAYRPSIETYFQKLSEQ